MNSTLYSTRPASHVMSGTRRILASPAATRLADHLRLYGPLQSRSPVDLTAEVSASGLLGRGGAGFPTATKLEAVRRAAAHGRGRLRVPVVVGNGTEGEPASAKDQAVLTVAPHLVLDGLVMAATAVGADRAILCVDRTSLPAVDAVRRALGERSGRDAVTIELAETPPRYTTGEETALVSWLNGGMAKPAFAPPRPYERGVDGRPTLVDNVETLAHIALIARFGADAYRQVGDPNEPGTALLTVAGAAHRRGVLEVETGTALSEVLDRAGAASVAGVLVGGYFGTWLTPAEARSVSLSNGALRSIGASMGCGLVAVLPEGHCPLQEVSDVLGWLASSSAGQCGACVNGLPALAGAFQEIALVGDRDATASGRLDRWAPMIAGRGACKLPDGAIRFMESARRVFADHLDRHRLDGPCPTNKTAFLPTPRPGEWR